MEKLLKLSCIGRDALGGGKKEIDKTAFENWSRKVARRNLQDLPATFFGYAKAQSQADLIRQTKTLGMDPKPKSFVNPGDMGLLFQYKKIVHYRFSTKKSHMYFV